MTSPDAMNPEPVVAYLRAVRDMAAWLRDAARYLDDVERPCAVRAAQHRGVKRDALRYLIGTDGKPLTITRVDQVVAQGKAYELGRADQPPPDWFLHPAFGPPAPPVGYSPMTVVTGLVPPPLPLL